MPSDPSPAAPLYPPTVAPFERRPSLPRYIARFIRNPLAALPREVFEEPLVTLRDDGRFLVWLTDPALVETVMPSTSGTPKRRSRSARSARRSATAS